MKEEGERKNKQYVEGEGEREYYLLWWLMLSVWQNLEFIAWKTETGHVYDD